MNWKYIVFFTILCYVELSSCAGTSDSEASSTPKSESTKSERKITYKLTYFNLTGVAEPVRFLLSYLQADFEDIRIDYFGEWPGIKSTMPFGKLPVLEIDGKVFNQSTPIARYLAKQAQLAGRDDWEALLVDVAVENLVEFRQMVAVYFYDETAAADVESKKLKYQSLFRETIPFYMKKFESIVAENQGYFVNGKLTWADLFFVAAVDYSSYLAGIDLLADCPRLQALKATVVAIPQINAWIAKRPVTKDLKQLIALLGHQ